MNPQRTEIRELMLSKPAATTHQEQRHKAAAASENGEEVRQDLQEDCRAGDKGADSRVSDWAS
jgi:uncharacterized membrane protein